MESKFTCLYGSVFAGTVQRRKKDTGGNTSSGADASTAFHLWRCTGTIYKSSCEDLELTPTSISRASRQLEEMGLLHIRKVGVQRIMQSEDSPKTLFQKAGDKLLNPIKRTVYIPKELVGTELLESGYSALAEYSMLNTPNVRCYAAERISQWKDVMTNSLQNSLVQVAVEMWRYNPRKLSTRNIVDELSLALALREDADERVEEAVEEMLNELWRKIDGYRN